MNYYSELILPNPTALLNDSTEIWKLASAICITGLTVYAATAKANSK